jgi:hypothetical protein
MKFYDYSCPAAARAEGLCVITFRPMILHVFKDLGTDLSIFGKKRCWSPYGRYEPRQAPEWAILGVQGHVITPIMFPKYRVGAAGSVGVSSLSRADDNPAVSFRSLNDASKTP